jgi:Zn-finger nucleic acid-binding protein
MKCARCFLELIIAPQHDKKVDKYPKCKGIWLDGNSSNNMIKFTNEDNTMRYTEDLEDQENTFDENYDNKLQNGYYYYKKLFKESRKLDDVFDFE